MADEAVVQTTLQIRKGNLLYQPRSIQFRADVTGTKGPCPGAIAVSIYGTNVDFSELTTPALCRITNIDDTNRVEFGIWDSVDSRFFPLGELLPGESYVLRLSRNLGESYDNTGTGTAAATNSLRFKADTADVVVVVEAFEQ